MPVLEADARESGSVDDAAFGALRLLSAASGGAGIGPKSRYLRNVQALTCWI
jgi:hypothetical protein